jgi:predicted NBD/HSP70 family sugar kinase
MTATRRTSRDIRSESRLVVMRALLAAGESTRSDLARETGLSVATVATIVGDLLKRGMAIETGPISGTVGRPTTGLRLNPDRGRIVGVYVDVEETVFEATVFDAALGELATVEVTADVRLDRADEIIDGIVNTLDTALERAQANRDDVIGVGLLLPGGMQRPVKASASVPDAIWLHLDRLRDRLGLPVVVDNPLKAIATGELWVGAGRRYANVITVSLGIGVGAGIVQDGAVLRGASNAAGEWGHSLLAFEGRQCQCGRKGCVEAYIGAAGIQQTLAQIAPEHPLASTGLRECVSTLAAAVATGAPDPAASETIERTAHYLGAALADLVAVINPEAIMLTGWMEESFDQMLPTIRRRVLDDAPGDAAVGLAIEVSEICGLTGIAAVTLERFMRDVGLVTTKALPAL